MVKKPRSLFDRNPLEHGNFVSEWFGYRVYPIVKRTARGLAVQQKAQCPFLSSATGEKRSCIKPQSSRGVCTISSRSNGPRQDWLVCPYRALDPQLFGDVARRLFSLEISDRIELIPAPELAKQHVRSRVTRTLGKGGVVIVYFQGKLGGEISLRATNRSPQVSFDTTLVQLTFAKPNVLTAYRYGIFEIQTMDFHGPHRRAVQNLNDALRLHQTDFPEVLQRKPEWLSEKIEGPNSANVFKRTFYQMMLKFHIGAHGSCVGCVLALPRSVWDSWQKHLGLPDLALGKDGTYALRAPSVLPGRTPAWIYVFDVQSTPGNDPDPIVVTAIITTDADSVAHYALKIVPEMVVAESGVSDRILQTIRRRLAIWWPEIGST